MHAWVEAKRSTTSEALPLASNLEFACIRQHRVTLCMMGKFLRRDPVQHRWLCRYLVVVRGGMVEHVPLAYFHSRAVGHMTTRRNTEVTQLSAMTQLLSYSHLQILLSLSKKKKINLKDKKHFARRSSSALSGTLLSIPPPSPGKWCLAIISVLNQQPLNQMLISINQVSSLACRVN